MLGFGPCVESDFEEAPPTDVVQEPETPAPPPSLSLSELQEWPPASAEAASAAALRAGLAAYALADFEAALQSFERAVEGNVAPQLVAWKRGQTLERLGRVDEAITVWASIPEGARLAGDARLAAAAAQHRAEAPAASLKTLESFPELDDQGPANSAQLRAELLRGKALIARGEGGDRNLAYQACARAWAHAGSSSSVAAEAESCLELLAEEVPEENRRGLSELSLHAAGLGRSHSNSSVIALLEAEEQGLEESHTDAPVIACRGKLELGRAWHKKRKYSQSIPRLRWAAENCPEGDAIIRAHYLLAQSLQRGGKTSEAIKAWKTLSERWPEHRFADDGLFHAGEIQLRGGKLDEARASFSGLAEKFPEGDMVPSGLWGMAWAAIEAKQPGEALEWLKKQAALAPDGPHHERVLQARYWIARLLLDEANETSDSSLKGEALAKLSAIATDAPFNWYGLLAFWRVHQEAPQRAADLALEVRGVIEKVRSGPLRPDTFVYEREFDERPGFREGLQLLRSGLHDHAVTEIRFALGRSPWNRWSTDTLLLGAALLQDAGAPNFGHELLRRKFKKAMPGLSPEERAIWVHAFPTAFGDEIATAAAEHPFDRWLFQGLVRDESAFTSTVRSWAGAMGLSQLMWGTAKESARKMGIGKITRSMLSDPALNLKIGSWYLSRLHSRWKGHLALAIGSYNAGPGAEKRWVDARGDYPLDAYVETIPFKQTRLYTKHVYASYQTYYALYGEDNGPFVPLRTGLVRAAIDIPDPKIERKQETGSDNEAPNKETATP